MTAKHLLRRLERVGTIAIVGAWVPYDSERAWIILWGGVRWGGHRDESGAGDLTFQSVRSARNALIEELEARIEAGVAS